MLYFILLYYIYFRQLQQRINHLRERPFRNRCKLLQNQIFQILDEEFRLDIQNQHHLLRILNSISENMKDSSESSKMVLMYLYMYL